MILHLVLFSPKAELSPPQRERLLSAVDRAFTGIPSIHRATVGQRLDLGMQYAAIGDSAYEYAAVIEFEDPEALKQYLAHPLHEELARAFWECCGRTLIHDCQVVR